MLSTLVTAANRVAQGVFPNHDLNLSTGSIMRRTIFSKFTLSDLYFLWVLPAVW